MIRRWKNLRTEPPVSVVDPVGALAAVAHARLMLAEERCRTGSTGEVTSRLKELQEKNHFADLLYAAMQPSKDGRSNGT